ncbi:hypothetical protein F4Y43_17890 [Candidatus Poribacteria bacterium]|nr:hypothetical protein [Candidatus Poribacteria bacterium]
MRNKIQFLKNYLLPIFLVIYGAMFVLTNAPLNLVDGVLYFSLLIILALALILGNRFPQRERLIWMICNTLFAAVTLYWITTDLFGTFSTSEQTGRVETSQEDTSIKTATVPSEETTQKPISLSPPEFLERTRQQAPFADLNQKLTDIMKSEDFTKMIEESRETGITPEPLTSFSKFQKYLVSQGLTEVGNIDIENMFQDAFQEHFPGKVPAALDNEMKNNFVLTIQKFGYEKAKKEFLKNPRNALWLSARFDPVLDMGKTLGTWPERLIADNFGDRTINEILGIPSAIPSLSSEPTLLETSSTQLTEIFSDTELDHTIPQEPVEVVKDNITLMEKNTPQILHEDITPENIAEIEPIPPKLPTFQDFENTLRQQFDPERFSPRRINAAIQTLNQYGPEEGLRKLKVSDSEVAREVQRLIEGQQEDNY